MASAAEWKKRVEAWRKSGLSAGEFSEGQGFAQGTLRYWAWRVEKPGAAKAEPEPLRIVQLARPRTSSAAASLTIEVNGARVTVPAGVDRETLSAVLAALAEAVRPL
jgi:hypothetical protein